MQSVRSRIWTRVAVSISCDDNHYITGTSKHAYEYTSILHPAKKTYTYVKSYQIFRIYIKSANKKYSIIST